MTTRFEVTTPVSSRRSAPATRPAGAIAFERYAVPTVALVAALVRVPFLGRDASRDEAGFLLVGQQWHAGGSSLYGSYWVDRPPLLITIFKFAADLGGLVPLRLIGCVATILVVLGSAHVAGRIGGRRAARCAALTAAALTVSPLLGGLDVNGELLSAPFVVGGMAAALTALDPRGGRRALLAAGAAGAATVGALLVKQNIADVAVFAGVAGLVAWRQGTLTTPALLRPAATYLAGALVALGLMGAWTVLHGTSLQGVFDAMYPFRLEAGRVLAASNRTTADARARQLVIAWAVSGVAVVMALAAFSLITRRLRGPAVWGLVATIGFDVVSIAVGGSYWSHYLIQLVVPVAIAAGLLVAARQPAARTVVSAIAVTSVIALGVVAAGPQTAEGSTIGRAIGRVADRHDTIITDWGHADITRASGLTSPYPYLWALPARTLDPRRAALDEVLAGPGAPTWFVAKRGSDIFSGGSQTARLLSTRYRLVARLGKHVVYLQRGARRSTPVLSSTAAQEKP